MHIGHLKILLLPDLLAHQRQRITEGGLRLVISGRLADGQLSSSGVLMGQQCHQRKEAQQDRCREQGS
jgi:hypothetical protein